MKRTATPLAALLAFLLVSSTAWAHPGHDVPASGLLAGLLHPVLGLDHLLTMVTVGLLSAQRGGQAVWALPGTFLVSMIAGGTAGMLGTQLPAVELSIALSIVVLGAAVSLDRRVPIGIPAVLVALFGFVHGVAHGGEMPTAATPALYAAGFVLATFVLHATGVLVAWLALRSNRGLAGLRLSGAAIALAGVYFAIRG